ncbi:MAG: SPASM domain-containing protein [Bacteroidetes bacterium]|nr:SPASM domain-containing protein [Bacteroidota bacterium]
MNTHPRDILNLLSKLSVQRFANASLVWLSYYWSRMRGKSWHPAFPISISIEPTTSCNLRCPECPSGLRSFTRPIGMLEQEFFRSVIDDVSKKVLYLTFYFQGEPFLNPGFLEMVSYAAAKKMYTATSTNAHYLDDETAKRTVESGLDRLIISIDGTTQETYEQYRIGGKLEKVLEGARNIVKWKKNLNKTRPYVVFQFLVVKPNEHQTEEVKKLAREIGVDDVAFKTAQVYDYENGNTLIPENEKYSRYRKQDDGTFALKNKLLNHCWKLWHSCVITWDGTVVPCCFDKDADHKMGNLKELNFQSIWKNDAYQSFRRSLMKSRKEIDICKNCSEGTKVWAD